MISSDGIRGYNDVIILSVLKEGDSYGYAVSQKIRDVSEEVYVIKETTLYSAFNRGLTFLEEKRNEWKQTKKVVNRFMKEG